MEGAYLREAPVGRRPFMPRKALATARAALQFAFGGDQRIRASSNHADERCLCPEKCASLRASAMHKRTSVRGDARRCQSGDLCHAAHLHPHKTSVETCSVQ